MYRILQGKPQDLPDVTEFIGMLNELEEHPVAEARQLFDQNRDLVVTRAPGRLDVMGGIADYSGSLVLELPIREATLAAIQPDPECQLRIVSLTERSAHAVTFEMPLSDLEVEGQPVDYESARGYFARNPANHWAAYVAGVFLVLMRERDVSFREGARILIASRVPQGKGVSSSAALEVAAAQAISAAFDLSLDASEIAVLCQMVENLVVGAPCGVMDQMTASCGEDRRLLQLLCQPAELRGSISVPEDIRFWGIDSGIRHAVTGADYGSVRTGAFMGYRIIAGLAGLNVTEQTREGTVSVEDPRWNGYLANITPAEFEKYREALPESISGEDFLARYSGTPDPVTR
ncbi:MAG TPA: galactokinase family protein, partial [Blastocatellia bacterium]|nr:galactokinase family protein [Blastocatellia bacterium]